MELNFKNRYDVEFVINSYQNLLKHAEEIARIVLDARQIRIDHAHGVYISEIEGEYITVNYTLLPLTKPVVACDWTEYLSFPVSYLWEDDVAKKVKTEMEAKKEKERIEKENEKEIRRLAEENHDRIMYEILKKKFESK